MDVWDIYDWLFPYLLYNFLVALNNKKEIIKFEEGKRKKNYTHHLVHKLRAHIEYFNH